MDTNTNTTPTLAEIIGTLDELAAAARTGDVERYRAAVGVAQHQQITNDQQRDAYRWGRRGQNGPPQFDWQGTRAAPEPRRTT